MLNIVRRQQELRLRLLQATYKAMLENPDAYMQALSLSIASTNDTPTPPTETDQAPRPKIDFTNQPPNQAELKAAAYYLIERGYLNLMPSESIEINKLDPKEIYVRMTASGLEVFEGLVLSANTKTERQIGFSMSSPDFEQPKIVVRPSNKPPALPETMELG